jgi:transcription elongation factor GreA
LARFERQRSRAPTPRSDADVAAMSERPPTDRAYLTAHGRRLLEERIRILETTVDELHRNLDDPELRSDSIDEYQGATRELASLRSHLESAMSIEDMPDDPRVAELGDTVAIRLDDGTEETYIIVHALEAPVDDQRISVESPLGRALLYRHVGETVEVAVPTGSYRCTILSATRDIQPDHTA